MKKRFGAALLGLLLGTGFVLSLTGCGSKQEDEPKIDKGQPGDKMPAPRGAMGSGGTKAGGAKAGGGTAASPD